ncbi:DUF1801 domain-containing protein [uncultured Winogradskyella sp.]|uniref:DUF1801 domain-containing protein n=1 Tax=uncultured Winogradskyella sp. TaxID=395353 RepID=UPI002614D5C4|nr:DUF1801 domain-containing protein [uncultured Winogradskyella sp.]
MTSLENFKNTFVRNSKAQQIGLKLRTIVLEFFSNIEENFYGGSKVKMTLYSRNGSNNVLCGIQQSANDTCMLYVHHVDNISHEKLKFSGKGKHAKRVKFESIDEVSEDDIKWLLQQVNDNAPF